VCCYNYYRYIIILLHLFINITLQTCVICEWMKFCCSLLHENVSINYAIHFITILSCSLDLFLFVRHFRFNQLQYYIALTSLLRCVMSLTTIQHFVYRFVCLRWYSSLFTINHSSHYKYNWCCNYYRFHRLPDTKPTG